MAKRKIPKNVLGFNIPEDFEEKYDKQEMYKTIIQNKKIYAITTFARAVPFEKDGLIDIYRRSLWDMIFNDNRHNKPYCKSAEIVGGILGKWHPHGDASAYQAMVTLAKDFTNNYPLIDGAGNWSKVTGDPAAAARYTECRLSKFFDDVCEDIRPECVDFQPNYNAKYQEPCYIPFKIPMLLVNGSYGIADSYMTSVLPHNLNDVVEVCKKYIRDKSIDLIELCEGFYPDCPNYGIITNAEEIESCYKLGMPANVKMKATIEINREENTIVIKDLPYGMTELDVLNALKTQNEKKHAVLSKVIKLIEMKTEREGELHIEYDVEFDKSANILEVARDLEKYCLCKTIPCSMIEFDGSFVHNVSIKKIIEKWYETLYTTKTRKIQYQYNNIATKKHIIEGMIKIYDHIDEYINFVKTSTGQEDCIRYLTNKHGLTDIQSKAITEMQSYKFSKLSKQTLIDQVAELQTKLDELDGKLLVIDDEIISDLDKIKATYGRPRRTMIQNNDEINETKSSTIPMSNGAVIWTRNQYSIFDLNGLLNSKNLINGLRSIKVDGKAVKEIIGLNNINSDINSIIIFTNDGAAKRIDVSEIVGTNSWITISDEPIIKSIIPVSSEDEKIIIVSDDSKIRVITVDQFGKQSVKVGGVSLAQKLNPNCDYVIFMNSKGAYHLIKISDIPELGRSASGVMIDLNDDVKNVEMVQIERDSDEMLICSVVDTSDGSTYVMKGEQSLLEDTNRINKPKKLFELDNNFKITNINKIDISDKNMKNLLIGKNNTTTLANLTVRLSDMGKVPKKVSTDTVGIVSYNL